MVHTRLHTLLFNSVRNYHSSGRKWSYECRSVIDLDSQTISLIHDLLFLPFFRSLSSSTRRKNVVRQNVWGTQKKWMSDLGHQSNLGIFSSFISSHITTNWVTKLTESTNNTKNYSQASVNKYMNQKRTKRWKNTHLLTKPASGLL